MLAALFRTLGLSTDDGERHETETVADIATVLTGLSPERARLLAEILDFARLSRASSSSDSAIRH